MLYLRNPGGKFEVVEGLGIEDAHESGRGVSVNDLDGDGMLDLVYANHEGPNRVFLQRSVSGRVEFASALKGQAMAETSNTRAVIAADFDNDGWVEVFFNNVNGPNRMFTSRNGKEWEELKLGPAAENKMLGTTLLLL